MSARRRGRRKHVEAIEACAKLLAAGRKKKLGVCDTLDIGGGFPIDYRARAGHRPFCAPIRAALASFPKRVRIIAEPGRFIAGPSAIGVASVMGRAQREGHWWYYLDDGLYGSYSGQLYDHARYPVEPLEDRTENLPSVLAGPTCDSIDVIAENLMLPELKAGDLIVGRAMGAYTWASASEFNFFPKATVVSVNASRAIRGRSYRCLSDSRFSAVFSCGRRSVAPQTAGMRHTVVLGLADPVSRVCGAIPDRVVLRSQRRPGDGLRSARGSERWASKAAGWS